MTAIQKITLSSSRDIPFDKLVLSQANVRRVKAGVSIEELAEDIARRGLLQGLNVRAVVDAEGVATGMFEIPAGGRRYRALQLLAKQKRLSKTTPVPCVVREGGIAEEDSLAENVQRAPLHPLDQFRAFLALREKGESEEEVAAAFFVPVAVVRQRLKLASVSPKLLEVYAEDAMTLDQLMAFTVNGDHERQEQVFERLTSSYDKSAHAIRRMLTEGAVRASDKRAQFVGVDAYVEAGGAVLRDLFQGDEGGWLQDVALVDRMVADKLGAEVEAIRAEGWRWVEAALELPYGHTFGLRQLRGEVTPMSAQEEATAEALQQEVDDIEAASAEAEELTEVQDQRMAELEAALQALNDRPVVFGPEEIERAGAFVSIDRSGRLVVERGFVRGEDEAPVIEPDGGDGSSAAAAGEDAEPPTLGEPQARPSEAEEEDGMRPLPDRLVAELTAFRTVALRQTLGANPEMAFLAALHALCLPVFYVYSLDSCLELSIKTVGFSAQTPELKDSAAARTIEERHAAWSASLPETPEELWDALTAFDSDSRQALFAHCIGQGVNAVVEGYSRRPRAIVHADKLAQALDLDVVAAGWSPTADSFLGRVTKARILAAVAEAKGQRAADRIAHLKKGEMASEAETLLEGSRWLPELLRTAGRPPLAADLLTADADEDHDAAKRTDGDLDPPLADIDAALETEPTAFHPHAVAAE